MNFNCLILQRLLDELGLVALALVLPAAYIEVVLIVALGLAFLRLILLAEVTTAGLVTREGIELSSGRARNSGMSVLTWDS